MSAVFEGGFDDEVLEVQRFLKSWRLGCYFDLFLREGWDSMLAIEELPTDPDFLMKIKPGHRAVLLRAVRSLKEDTRPLDRSQSLPQPSLPRPSRIPSQTYHMWDHPRAYTPSLPPGTPLARGVSPPPREEPVHDFRRRDSMVRRDSEYHISQDPLGDYYPLRRPEEDLARVPSVSGRSAAWNHPDRGYHRLREDDLLDMRQRSFASRHDDRWPDDSTPKRQRMVLSESAVDRLAPRHLRAQDDAGMLSQEGQHVADSAEEVAPTQRASPPRPTPSTADPMHSSVPSGAPSQMTRTASGKPVVGLPDDQLMLCCCGNVQTATDILTTCKKCGSELTPRKSLRELLKSRVAQSASACRKLCLPENPPPPKEEVADSLQETPPAPTQNPLPKEAAASLPEDVPAQNLQNPLIKEEVADPLPGDVPVPQHSNIDPTELFPEEGACAEGEKTDSAGGQDEAQCPGTPRMSSQNTDIPNYLVTPESAASVRSVLKHEEIDPALEVEEKEEREAAPETPKKKRRRGRKSNTEKAKEKEMQREEERNAQEREMEEEREREERKIKQEREQEERKKKRQQEREKKEKERERKREERKKAKEEREERRKEEEREKEERRKEEERERREEEEREKEREREREKIRREKEVKEEMERKQRRGVKREAEDPGEETGPKKVREVVSPKESVTGSAKKIILYEDDDSDSDDEVSAVRARRRKSRVKSRRTVSGTPSKEGDNILVLGEGSEDMPCTPEHATPRGGGNSESSVPVPSRPVRRGTGTVGGSGEVKRPAWVPEWAARWLQSSSREVRDSGWKFGVLALGDERYAPCWYHSGWLAVQEDSNSITVAPRSSKYEVTRVATLNWLCGCDELEIPEGSRGSDDNLILLDANLLPTTVMSSPYLLTHWNKDYPARVAVAGPEGQEGYCLFHKSGEWEYIDAKDVIWEDPKRCSVVRIDAQKCTKVPDLPSTSRKGGAAGTTPHWVPEWVSRVIGSEEGEWCVGVVMGDKHFHEAWVKGSAAAIEDSLEDVRVKEKKKKGCVAMTVQSRYKWYTTPGGMPPESSEALVNPLVLPKGWSIVGPVMCTRKQKMIRVSLGWARREHTGRGDLKGSVVLRQGTKITEYVLCKHEGELQWFEAKEHLTSHKWHYEANPYQMAQLSEKVRYSSGCPCPLNLRNEEGLSSISRMEHLCQLLAGSTPSTWEAIGGGMKPRELCNVVQGVLLNSTYALADRIWEKHSDGSHKGCHRLLGNSSEGKCRLCELEGGVVCCADCEAGVHVFCALLSEELQSGWAVDLHTDSIRCPQHQTDYRPCGMSDPLSISLTVLADGVLVPMSTLRISERHLQNSNALTLCVDCSMETPYMGDVRCTVYGYGKGVVGVSDAFSSDSDEGVEEEDPLHSTLMAAVAGKPLARRCAVDLKAVLSGVAPTPWKIKIVTSVVGTDQRVAASADIAITRRPRSQCRPHHLFDNSNSIFGRFDASGDTEQYVEQLMEEVARGSTLPATEDDRLKDQHEATQLVKNRSIAHTFRPLFLLNKYQQRNMLQAMLGVDIDKMPPKLHGCIFPPCPPIGGRPPACTGSPVILQGVGNKWDDLIELSMLDAFDDHYVVVIDGMSAAQCSNLAGIILRTVFTGMHVKSQGSSEAVQCLLECLKDDVPVAVSSSRDPERDMQLAWTMLRKSAFKELANGTAPPTVPRPIAPLKRDMGNTFDVCEASRLVNRRLGVKEVPCEPEGPAPPMAFTPTKGSPFSTEDEVSPALITISTEEPTRNTLAEDKSPTRRLNFDASEDGDEPMAEKALQCSVSSGGLAGSILKDTATRLRANPLRIDTAQKGWRWAAMRARVAVFIHDADTAPTSLFRTLHDLLSALGPRLVVACTVQNASNFQLKAKGSPILRCPMLFDINTRIDYERHPSLVGPSDDLISCTTGSGSLWREDRRRKRKSLEAVQQIVHSVSDDEVLWFWLVLELHGRRVEQGIKPASVPEQSLIRAAEEFFSSGSPNQRLKHLIDHGLVKKSIVACVGILYEVNLAPRLVLPVKAFLQKKCPTTKSGLNMVPSSLPPSFV